MERGVIPDDPEIQDAIERFYLLLTVPNAVNYARLPGRERAEIRALSFTYHSLRDRMSAINTPK